MKTPQIDALPGSAPLGIDRPLNLDTLCGLVADLLDHNRSINATSKANRRFRDGEINALEIVHRIILGGSKAGAETYVDILTGGESHIYR